MKLNWIIISIVLGITLQSCIKTPDIIPPEAEITEIYGITDSSASFSVVVFKKSNAQWDYGYEIWLDTVPLEERLPLIAKSLTEVVLDSFYIANLTGLYSNSQYFARIRYYGVYDIGGPNDLKESFVGEQKEFTTLP